MNEAVFQWLASYGGPATTAELWDELTLKGNREPPEGLPQRLSELSQAMRELVIAGKVEERDDKWHVVRKVVREERQLF